MAYIHVFAGSNPARGTKTGERLWKNLMDIFVIISNVESSSKQMTLLLVKEKNVFFIFVRSSVSLVG